MKTIRKKQYLWFFLVILVVAICGCQYDKFNITEKPYVDRTSVEIYVGAGADDRSTAQLKSSPDGRQYTWTSLDPGVAIVSQTGLVTAQQEGFTVVSVASADDVTDVNVWVRNWVPLKNFTLDQSEVIKFWMDRFRINATSDPVNATEAGDIQWSTSDPSVASVSDMGWVTCYGKGTAVITARTPSGIEKTVQVSVLPSLTMDSFLPRTDWTFPGYLDGSQDETIGYDSQATNEGGSPQGRVIAMLDDNLGTFWHARWGSPASKYPHWFIVDLNRDVEITGVMLQRRQENGATAKGFRLYTCATEPDNENDPVNGYAWEDQGEYSFNPNINEAQRIPLLPPFPRARYVKMYFDTNHRGTGDYAMFAEFGLFGEAVP